MSAFRVMTPVPDYTGHVGSIHFQSGSALVPDDARELHHMVQVGYRITDENGQDVADPLAHLREIAAAEVKVAIPVMQVRIVDDAPPALAIEPEVPVVTDVDGDGVNEELPKKAASVAEWRAFAVAHEMSQADADGMTKDALVAFYYTPKEGSK